jgi:hypothetical protein
MYRKPINRIYKINCRSKWFRNYNNYWW